MQFLLISFETLLKTVSITDFEITLIEDRKKTYLEYVLEVYSEEYRNKYRIE